MIHMSPAAIQEVHRLSQRQQAARRIHLTLTTGGCADWQYQLSFVAETATLTGLVVFTVQDIDIAIDPAHLPYLTHLSIDYSEDLMGGGFRFDNPNALQHCGCGHSFTPRSGGQRDL